MGRRDTWLGYVAIAVGVLALLMSLGGGMRGSRVAIYAPGMGPQQAVPAPPPVMGDPLFCGGGAVHCGPGAAFRGGSDMFWGHGDVRGGSPFGFVAWIVGGLVKLGLAALAILIGLRFLRGRGGSSSPGGQVPPPAGPAGYSAGSPTELRAPGPQQDQPTYL